MTGLLEHRVLLVTGKGGVGKSTVTAALAEVARQAGKRVLVCEIGDGSDDYSALAQLFGRSQLPRQASEIAPGIWGSQLLAETGVELFLGSVIRIPMLVKTALGFEPLRRFFSAAPSLREMGFFFHLLTYIRAEQAGRATHELIVVDMPATGHTLALTGLPQVVLGLVNRGPIANALRDGQSYLNDPQKAAAVVVTLPETLPITEALELVDGLEKTAMHTAAIFVNRLPQDDFTDEERQALNDYLRDHPLFGQSGFRKSEEAQVALRRLKSATSLPSSQLPELDEGPKLVAELAQSLSTTLAETR